MNVPLPVEVAACRTRGELVELLAGLLLETDEPETMTVHGWAEFRHDCRDRLPAAQAEWIDSVPFADVWGETIRQLEERDDLPAVQAAEIWAHQAVDGDYQLVDGHPDAEGRAWVLRVLFRRRSLAGAMRDRADAEIAHLMQEPPGGWVQHSKLLAARRWRSSPSVKRRNQHG